MALEDSAGNVLGRRGLFVYTSDVGDTFNIQQDLTVGLAAGNTLSTDASLPALSTSSQFPLRCRYILVTDTDEPSKKKRIVIGSPANALFTAAGSTEFIINGETFAVTSRSGEKRSTRVLTPLIDPP